MGTEGATTERGTRTTTATHPIRSGGKTTTTWTPIWIMTPTTQTRKRKKIMKGMPTYSGSLSTSATGS